MSTRPIAFDSDAGRYVFSGTSIFVAELQRDFKASGDRFRTPYLTMGLTADEIDQALSFTFPSARAARIEPRLVAFDAVCACGERRHAVVTPPTFMSDECICGRRWRIHVDAEPLPAAPVNPDM